MDCQLLQIQRVVGLVHLRLFLRGLKTIHAKVVSPLGCFSKKATLLPIKILRLILLAAVSVHHGPSADQPVVLSSYDPAKPTVPHPGTGGARPLIKTLNGWPLFRHKAAILEWRQ